MSASKMHKDKGFGKRSRYNTSLIARFRTKRQLEEWTEERRQKGLVWRFNTRYDSKVGLTEYWHCAHKEDGLYICPARMKILFNSIHGIFVFASGNRQHNHDSLPPPVVDVPQVMALEPYPLQRAQIINMTPRIVTHPTNVESTSTNAEQTGSREPRG
uniref:FLYWCH-type domain-containing protein n=1 Tax=Meloidogyne incognita TaxID=6306 RepID=A0A914M7F2_MELIC